MASLRDSVLDDPLPCGQERGFHLLPLTLEHVLTFNEGLSQCYDYVEGLCVEFPYVGGFYMAKYHTTALECAQPMMVYSTPSVQVVDKRSRLECALSHDAPRKNRDLAPASTAKRASRRTGVRHPYLLITALRYSSDSSSGIEIEQQIKDSIMFPHPYEDTVLAAVEIVQHFSRHDALTSKWNAYARSQVPLYIIFDCDTESTQKRALVGSLQPFPGAQQSMSRDSCVPPMDTLREGRAQDAYYRKEYGADEIVDCPHYDVLQMTPAELLDLRGMGIRSADMRDTLAMIVERTGIEERRRKEATRERKEATRRRKEAEQRLEELRREIDEEIRGQEANGEELGRNENTSVSTDAEKRTTRAASRNAEKAIRDNKRTTRAGTASSPQSGLCGSQESDAPEHKKSRKKK